MANSQAQRYRFDCADWLGLAFGTPESTGGKMLIYTAKKFGIILSAKVVQLNCETPMSPETLKNAATMVLAGIGIPVLAALNAQLGNRIGSPAAAASVLFLVAAIAAALTMMIAGSPDALRLIPSQPTYLLGAGLLVAFYVLSITWIAPRFGVGNAIFCVLFGQMISASIIDHFGLVGAVMEPLTALRIGGLGLMALGILLIQKG